jgi:hypothetical protein
MVLFHFIFEMIKIGILSFLYATILLLILIITTKITKPKRQIFSEAFTIFFGCLFLFMFTYYGDHGLGDASRIPIGHWESIDASDGYPYFKPEGKRTEMRIYNFAIKNDVLSAEVDSGYISYDLRTDKLSEFKNERDYNLFALKNSLPMPKEFAEFYIHYKNYWGGWRFWVLP